MLRQPLTPTRLRDYCVSSKLCGISFGVSTGSMEGYSSGNQRSGHSSRRSYGHPARVAIPERLHPSVYASNNYSRDVLTLIRQEILRVHGAGPLFLPRVVPAGGAMMDGYFIPEGTVRRTQLEVVFNLILCRKSRSGLQLAPG